MLSEVDQAKESHSLDFQQGGCADSPREKHRPARPPPPLTPAPASLGKGHCKKFSQGAHLSLSGSGLSQFCGYSAGGRGREQAAR